MFIRHGYLISFHPGLEGTSEFFQILMSLFILEIFHLGRATKAGQDEQPTGVILIGGESSQN